MGVDLRAASLLPILLISAVTWVGRFWHFRDFGLYEDDHYRITVTLNWSWEEISNWLDLISFNGSLGRIFHDVLIYVLAKVGWNMGGVAGMYLIGFAVLLLNNILFYLLLRRIDFPRAAALFGALVFALFTPDFTQVFLTHALGIHPGVTCLLVAAHLFLAGRRLPALIVVVPCLFIYESVYLLFLAVPLLALAGNRIRWQWAACYVGATAAVFGLLSYLRFATGDNRTVDAAGKLDRILPIVWRNVSTGPFQCLKWMFVLPAEALPDLQHRAPLFLAMVLLSGATLWWLWRTERLAGPTLSLPLRYVCVGAVLLFLSYPLLFEMNPAVLIGRTSRVHLAAMVGASLVLASLVWILQAASVRWRLRLFVIPLMALFCGMSILSAFRVQDDYRTVWGYQQGLWTDVIRQSPDLAPGTLVLVPRGDVVRHIGFWPWGRDHTRLAEHFYRFPADGTPPRLFFLRPDWEERVAASGDLFDGVQNGFSRELLEEHRGAPVHFYRMVKGKLHRQTGPLRTGAHEFELAALPPPRTQSSYPKAALWDVFVLPDGTPSADYSATAVP